MPYRTTLSLIVLALFFMGLTSLSYLLPHKPTDPHPENSPVRFIENKGQWQGDIRFKMALQNGEVRLEANKWAYAFYELPEALHHHGEHDAEEIPETWQLKGHQVFVEWIGGNPAPTTLPTYRFQEYYNYFLGNDPDRWAGGVPLYGAVTYQLVYDKIDLRFYGEGSGLKYDFWVAPGGDPGEIQLRYSGADYIGLEAGNLVIETTLGTVSEMAPLAYQETEGGRQIVPCTYHLEGEVLSFRFPEGYDRSLSLVIDPTLIFSTFTGSQADNWGFTATYDTAGNLYAGGIIYNGTLGTTPFPTTPGAFQSVHQGGLFEVTITKFNPTGTAMVYSTLLGGLANDQPHSLVTNDAGELFVFGRTTSTNFPVTTGAYDNTHNGGEDIFVAKFNPAGTALLAATYVGGSNDDANNDPSGNTTAYNYGDNARGEILLDNRGRVLVAACSRSGNFPVTSNAIQSTLQGGQDGVVFRMPADLSQLDWSTYLGGSGVDAAYGIQVNAQGTIFVTGGTTSLNFPAVSGGLISAYTGGRADGFIAKIDSSGSTLRQSTYIGTTSYDQTFLIQLDNQGNVYVAGQTESSSYPVVNAQYFDSQAKQFITKLNDSLNQIIYSTTFGTPQAQYPNLSPTAFLVDNCENVYFAGWGGITNTFGNTNNMPLTSDALQTTTDGSDFYLFVLERDADTILFATYLGGNHPLGFSGEHVDGGTSRFDKDGIVYHAVCANCGGLSAPSTTDPRGFPTTPNVWSNTNNSPNCNLAAFKLAFNFTGISANFVPLDSNNVPLSGGRTVGCPPLTVNFDNTSTPNPNATYFWDLGIPGATSNAFEPSFVYTQPGTYQVMLVVTDSTTCNISDTAYRTILVFPHPTVSAGPDQVLCMGDSVTLLATGSGTFTWTPTLGMSNSSIRQPQVSPPGNTQYIVDLVDTNGCHAKDSVWVRVDSMNWLSIMADTSVCEGDPLTLRAIGPPNAQYLWSPAAGLSDPRIANPRVIPDSATTFRLQVTNANGCTVEDSVNVSIYRSFIGPDTAVCLGTPVSLLAGGGIGYQWTPSAGLDNPNVANPRATPAGTTTYQVVVTHPGGCTTEQQVTVNILPLPDPQAGPRDTLCPGGTTTLFAGGGGTYQWFPATGLSSPTARFPVCTPAVTTTYTVLVTDANGCVGRDTVTITVNDPPPVDAGPDQEICEGESVRLTGTGALRYSWRPDPTLSGQNLPGPTVRPAGDTWYYLTGTDRFGCEASDSVQVRVIERPITLVFQSSDPCSRDPQIELRAEGGTRVVWSTGETTRSILVSPQTPTTYIATAYNQQCAGTPDSVTVSLILDFPEAAFVADPVEGFAPQPVQFTNQSQRAVSYHWDFGFGLGGPKSKEENPLFTFPYAGTFTVTLIAYSLEGCADTATYTFRFDNVALHVPSAFSPNADGFNDEFWVGYHGIRTLQVQIFSRWGMLIFEDDQPDFRWDGRYKGADVPEGVYVYVIRGIGENGLDYIRKGTVTVIR